MTYNTTLGGATRCATLAVLVFLATAVRAQPGVWPQRFLRADGTDHTLVVLYRDGTAAYSTRKKRMTGHRDYFFVAAKASWRWCDPPATENERKCIHLTVDGNDGRDEEVRFRFDYWYEDSRITEFDKSGLQQILPRLIGY
jgi:hypothetical protein